MRKRGVAAFLAALIVVLIGLLVSFFFIFSNNATEQYVITLPGQGTAVIDPSPEISDGNRIQLQAVQVDRTNIQAVIGRLRRPEKYHLQSETTYYYQDAFTTLKSQFWQDGEQIRVSQMNRDGSLGKQVILTNQWIYLWDSQNIISRFARQAQDIDLYNRSPSYTDLLALPSDSVLEGRLEELDGQLCLYAKTEDPLTGEVEQWYILSENGLLIYADGQLDGQPTYQMRLSGLELSFDSQDLFLLPDGTPAS